MKTSSFVNAILALAVITLFIYIIIEIVPQKLSVKYEEISYNNYGAYVSYEDKKHSIDSLKDADRQDLKDLECEFKKAAITNYYNMDILEPSPARSFSFRNIFTGRNKTEKEILCKRNKILEKYGIRASWTYGSNNNDWFGPMGLVVRIEYKFISKNNN